MPDPKDFFDDIYDLTSLDQTAAHYAKFAQAYEDAMKLGGYVTPGRCADALEAAGASKSAPALDVGCGSGLAGLALKARGFEILDGTDYSSEMLEQARKKDLYRDLWQGDLTEDQPDRANTYSTAIAAGVLSPSHAPASAINTVLAMLKPGGLVAFSLNDHAVKDGSYQGQVHMLIDSCTVDLMHREYGAHMPEQDLQAWVYVLRKR